MRNIIIYSDTINFVTWITKGGKHIPIYGKGEKSKQNDISYISNKIGELKSQNGKLIHIQVESYKQKQNIEEQLKKGLITKTQAKEQIKITTDQQHAAWLESQKIKTEIDTLQNEFTKLAPSKPEAIPPEISAHKFGMKYHKDVIEPVLTNSEVSALKEYKTIEYQKINGRARGEQINHNTDTMITQIDSALNKSALPKNITVYRGIRSDRKTGKLPASIQAVLANPTLAKGEIISDSAFTSTSLSKEFSKQWGVVAKQQVFMTINVPKGSKALYMDAISDTNEFEMLLSRNSKFKIKDIRIGHIPEIDVDLLGD